ncbi:MAG: response regulator transcription factor [Pseudomonadales bacterium]|nr:response regulator transcription factor [Pseudomonadales bacterium]
MEFRKVLILEDTPDTMEWLREIVQSAFEEADLTTATTLAEGLAAVAAQSFDLAIVDLGLPDGTGLTLIDEIRSKGANTYIVVATIYDDDKNLFDALRTGANGYVLKDDPKETLLRYLRGVREKRTPVSERAMDRVLTHFHQQGEARRESDLTDREVDVLRLIAKGYNVVETAGLLGLSVNTVKGYIKIVYSKLGISSRAEATAVAIKRNLIEI